MPVTAKHESSRPHPRESSFLNLLSGWAQQGVQSFFATQRILVDLAMRQNASMMHAVRQQLTDPHHSPTTILTDMAGEGMSNFIEAQKILLDMTQQQNEILMTGVKQRVGNWPAAQAMSELLGRSVETFIQMQHEFLKIADKHTHTWLQVAKNGKTFQGEHLVDVAREAMENFVKAQKQLLDVISEETNKMTGGKHMPVKKVKETELSDMARQATEAFVEAQKKLFDVAGRQMNANVKATGKTLELLKPQQLPSLAELTREGVKSYVDAQKALMDVMLKPRGMQHREVKKERHVKRPVHHAKKEPMAASHAVA